MAEVTVTDPNTGRDGDEPVAVVGMACRLPGAPDPSAFWQLLREGPGRDRAAPPADRQPGAARHGNAPAVTSTVSTASTPPSSVSPPARHWPWTPSSDSPSNWAGKRWRTPVYRPRLRRRAPPAGVYVGANLRRLRDPCCAGTAHKVSPGTCSPASSEGVIANRLSYSLGLAGASMTVDCGQSSSLVAVHLGRRQGLRRGESSLVLAGRRSTSTSAPESTLAVERFGGLSPDARCFTFDAPRQRLRSAARGGALVVLKPLSPARAPCRRRPAFYCVIHGSAVNHDGAGEALAVPNADGPARG